MPEPTIDFQQLLSTTDPYNLCPDCKVIRTPRSRHWNIWNRCVERFDHHCPYLNNCIGYRNHIWFLLFLFLMSLTLIYHICINIFVLIKGRIHEDCWRPICSIKPIIWVISYSVVYLGSWILFLSFVSILSFVHGLNFSK